MNIGRAAVIADDVVTNVIMVEVNDNGTTDFEIEGSVVVPLADDSPVSIGWSYVGDSFNEPPQEE